MTEQRTAIVEIHKVPCWHPSGECEFCWVFFADGSADAPHYIMVMPTGLADRVLVRCSCDGLGIDGQTVEAPRSLVAGIAQAHFAGAHQNGREVQS